MIKLRFPRTGRGGDPRFFWGPERVLKRPSGGAAPGFYGFDRFGSPRFRGSVFFASKSTRGFLFPGTQVLSQKEGPKGRVFQKVFPLWSRKIFSKRIGFFPLGIYIEVFPAKVFFKIFLQIIFMKKMSRKSHRGSKKGRCSNFWGTFYHFSRVWYAGSAGPPYPQRLSPLLSS